MARYIKKRKEDIGLSPDAVVFKGKQLSDEVKINIIDYDTARIDEKQINEIQEVLKYKETSTVTWLDIVGLHNVELISDLAEGFDIDSLIIADVLNTDNRPKAQEFQNGILTSIKMLQYHENTGKISVENLSILVLDNLLISFQEHHGDVFDPVRERIRNQKKRIITGGADYLAFALLDIVIDNYIYILSLLGDKIEKIEDRIFELADKEQLQKINANKKELNYLRKNIKPAKEMILALLKIDSLIIKKATHVHYKELLDNISHATESADSYRDMLSDQLTIYHTTISTRLNDIMRFLTVFSVIFIPLTFIAGIYGTNFEHIPELHYQYGYFLMLAAMFVVAAGMIYYFRRRKWL